MDAEAAVEELRSRLAGHLGDELVALYLFGSLAAGGFDEGRSDVDLLAVLRGGVHEEQLPALEALHGSFVAEHPEWTERVEVGYMSTHVLQTLASRPRGQIAVTSPGEPLHIKDVSFDWTLNWHGVATAGRTLLGPPPLELGPPVDAAAYRAAVAAQLEAWTEAARQPQVAFVPAHQGYIVVTVCRALYALAYAEPTTKQSAVDWAAARYPQWADFVREPYAVYRADRTERHRAVVRFVDFAAGKARQAAPRSMPGEGFEPPRR